MEGHLRHEDPRAAPAPGGRIHSSDATKKRAFLLLEEERRSLAAELRPFWRPKGRYEDLSLVMMLARLERDCLSRPRSVPQRSEHLAADGDQAGRRLADWAEPWGAAPRTKLETDLGRIDGALEQLGRWLSARTVAKARSRARQRLDAITAHMDQRAPAVQAVATRPRAATRAGDFRWATRTRVAAVAGFLLLAAGAGVFLLDSDTGGGPATDGRRGALDSRHPPPLEAEVKRGPAQRSQGPGQSATPLGHAKAQDGAQKGPPRPDQSAPVAAEIPSPAPEPAPVSPSPIAASPAPTPASSSPQPSSTSSQAKGAGGGGGCPPEFGYEC
jgi:hypothetical protein